MAIFGNKWCCGSPADKFRNFKEIFFEKDANHFSTLHTDKILISSDVKYEEYRALRSTIENLNPIFDFAINFVLKQQGALKSIF